MVPSRSLGVLALALLATFGLAGASNCGAGGQSAAFRFVSPVAGTLSAAGQGMAIELQLPPNLVPGSLELYVDGVKIPAAIAGDKATAGVASLTAGTHELLAWAKVPGAGAVKTLLRADSHVDVMVPPPAGCEELNAVECMLPYPSSRFLESAPTETGFRVSLPAEGMPAQNSAQGPKKKSPEPYKVLDGFSPTVQILMNFPGGMDPVVSNAPRLLDDRRGPDGRSLEADSPTVLIDAETGEHILHFIENDARATDPDRVATFLRPGKSLTPGRRYIVAVRNLKRADGTPVPPEPAFKALRDDKPITLASLAARKPAFEDLFAKLQQASVPRGDLILAFDFVVGSDHNLTFQMLSMRDQAFAWLDALPADAQPFTVTKVTLKDDCAAVSGGFHSQVEGTFQVPLFLSGDPITNSNSYTILNEDEDGNPVWNGSTYTNPPFTIGIPCDAIEGESASPKRGVILGHGLFGTGRGFVRDLVDNDVFSEVQLVAGATDWRGLSSGDIDPLNQSFVVNQVLLDFDRFRALPDRLRQGQLNTLVLARMMRTGVFNRHPAFQAPGGQGVVSDELMNYVGGSLGGIMGTMFAALTPDAKNHNLIVPAMNFSCLLQRATPFILFQDLLLITGPTDPLQVALGLGLLHELWVRGEPAGYVTHVTSDPLPGSPVKDVLISQAYLDQQVSNQCTEIMARTMNVPSLVGSLRSGMPQIPDLPGPLQNAYVEFDTGSFRFDIPEHAPFIPPLKNLQAEPNGCDPHGRQGFIPASILQLSQFFEDGGISNFCTGPGNLCDTVASDGAPSELPFGEPACDPLDD